MNGEVQLVQRELSMMEIQLLSSNFSMQLEGVELIEQLVQCKKVLFFETIKKLSYKSQTLYRIFSNVLYSSYRNKREKKKTDQGKFKIPRQIQCVKLFKKT